MNTQDKNLYFEIQKKNLFASVSAVCSVYNSFVLSSLYHAIGQRSGFWNLLTFSRKGTVNKPVGQQRIGPEYAGPLGLLQAIADGTKLLLKEDILPSRGEIPLFSIGPSIAVISILLSFLVIPLGYHFVLADLSIGVFLWIARSFSLNQRKEGRFFFTNNTRKQIIQQKSISIIKG